MKKKELDIRDEQMMQLEILHQFNNLCKCENIQYFAGYGTLLGAVREKGFIEWDDDIDLWIKRADVNKIENVFDNYFDKSKYFLQTYKSDPGCLSPEMLRICVNNTFKWDENIGKESFHTGIYFDIFPLDYGYSDKRDEEYLTEFTNRHIRLYSNLKRKWLKLNLKEKMKYIKYHLMSRKYLSKRVREIADLYANNVKSSIYVCVPTSYFGYERCSFDTEFFSESVNLQFEDMEISCPIGYHRLLIQLYGEDYMIPKVTKEERHKAFVIEEDEYR